jgi:hypothetical protein
MCAVRGSQPKMRGHIGWVGGAPCRHMRVRGSAMKHGAQALGGHGQRPGVKANDGQMGQKERWREDELDAP